MKLEQILTISARDYCKINGKQLSDYTAKGIHAKLTLYDPEKRWWDKGYGKLVWKRRLISKYIPEDTEAFVDFKIHLIKTWHDHYSGDNSEIFVNGTALIPRNKKRLK